MWEGRDGGFYKSLKKYFVAQGIIELNKISCPTSFFVKNFMVPSINFSFLFKAYGSIQRIKVANIHNNIQTVLFTGALHETFNLVFKLRRIYNV